MTQDGVAIPDRERLRELIRSASELFETKPIRARAIAEEARDIAERLEDTGAIATVYLVLGGSRLADGAYEEAESELRRSLDIAQALGDRRLMVKVLRQLLRCAFYTRNPDAALLRGMQALQLSRDVDDRATEALTHNDLGLVYGRLGDFEGALEHLLAGLRILQQDASSSVGSLLNNIGNVYLELGDNREALNFFQRALDPLRAEGAERAVGIALGNVGRANTALGNHEEALTAYEESLGRHRENRDMPYVPPALARLATALGALGQEEEARRVFDEALAMVANHQHGEFADEVYAAEGRFHLERNELDGAVSRLRQALDLIPADESTRRLYELHEALSEGLERRGDLQEALEHFKAYHRISQAVGDGSTTIRIRGLMLQFDVERTRQQEEIVRLRNLELLRENQNLQVRHEQLSAENRQLHQISIEDPLTSLYNRRYLDLQLGVEVSRARRYNRPMCVAMCDVDHFKEINDRHSHSVGDDVLRTIAVLFGKTARETDVVVRFGGEEFLLILTDTEVAGAESLAQRIRSVVSSHDWSELSAHLRVTLSIGVAELQGGMDSSALLAAADARLYAAKRAGRDCVVA
ncbi:MAG: diguanylate cyclase [Gemmatimonas sp.]|nr:diguanylate cyclase [Gemmatimonas sp.]